MITRPLGLNARLRPLPVAHDALFYFNVLLTVFFFSLFASRFVLAPGLGVDFRMPELKGARGGSVTGLMCL